MSEITTLTYAAGVTLRAATDELGETIVCLADLAHGLGIKNTSQLKSRLPKGVCRTYTLQTAGGPQSMLFVTEAGMNMVIWRSDKPEAIAYAQWCAERITELRHHGLTATPQTAEEILSDPDTMIRILQDLKAERAARANLEAQAVADRPKVLFADAVSTSSSEILVGDLAKILRDGSDWNMPTQKSMELELFRVKETAVVHSDGHTSLSKTPKVTGKGQRYFIDGFLSGRFSIEDGAA